MLISSRRKKPSFGAGKKSQVSILFSLLEAPRQVGLRRLAPRLQKSLRHGAFRSCPSTNIKALGMSPDEPEVPLLSRRHVGHASDLKAFLLARTRPIKIVARVNVFARDEREEGAGLAGEHLESREAELVLVGMSYKIAEGAWASGEIPRRCGPSHTSVAPDEAFDDMALYVKHTKGLVALTGCGHAGVENIMEYGLQVTGTDKLYAVIGGRARACRGYSLHWHCGYCGVTNCGEVGG
jgi:metal-dependent hydrolase (beta-lactamase superfamily II)